MTSTGSSTSTTSIRGAGLAHTTNGTGSTLIWGHGLSSSRASEDEEPLIEWERISVRVTRYDARGHGESTSTDDPDGYSWASLALDQLALADALGIGRYIGGGASMGCGTALHAAVTAPDRIERLVLAIPPTAWETRAAQTGQYEAAAHVLATRGVEPMIAASAELPPPDPFVGDEARRERRATAMRAWDTERMARVFRGATRADFPSREAVAAIGVPTLILAWTGDPAHPASTAEELDQLIPDSELHLASTADQLATWTDRIASFVA